MPSLSCSLCGSPFADKEHSSPRLSVFLCQNCGHREAQHAEASDSDYYENTPQEESYVSSLKETRVRQANEILDLVLPSLSNEDAWLDFGCGRGWFLDEAKKRKSIRVAGFDASDLATKWNRHRGLEMASASSDALWPDWKSLSFQPTVVSFFDVIEHFPQKEIFRVIQRMREEAPTIKKFVIKVPISNGFFFQSSLRVKQMMSGPYEQLFQTGTFPPHYHYFSKESFFGYIERLHLQVGLQWSDSDVDDLFQRIPSLSFLPGGKPLAKVLKNFPHDTYLVVAEVPEKG